MMKLFVAAMLGLATMVKWGFKYQPQLRSHVLGQPFQTKLKKFINSSSNQASQAALDTPKRHLLR